jgi:hypothetical protein
MSGRFSESRREQLATATAHGLLSAADKAKLDAQAVVTTVAAPLTLVAGALDIQAATASLEGSMSAADKARLDSLSTITTVASPLTLAAGTLDIQAATTSLEGSMSAADKTKLDGLPTITSIASPLTLAAGALDIQAASASLEGSMSAASFDRLTNWPVTRLNYTEGSDVANATNMGTAGTANTLVAAQNFTVNSTTAVLDVFVTLGALVNAPAALTQAVVRALVDGSTLYKLTAGIALASGWIDLHGAAFPIGPGLSAGTHTIALTAVASQNSALLYCRASSAPTYEFASITVIERIP